MNMTYLIFMNYIMLVGLYERMNIIENHIMDYFYIIKLMKLKINTILLILYYNFFLVKKIDKEIINLNKLFIFQ